MQAPLPPRKCAVPLPAIAGRVEERLLEIGGEAARWSALATKCNAGFQRAEARARRSPAYLTVITRPLRSALTMAPTERPVSVSTAPFWLVSTMACAPRPTAAPTLPAA